MRILVTRHKGLVEFFEKKGIRFDKVLRHASPEDVEGQEVWGVLPLSLSSLTSRFIEVTLLLSPELRGIELSCKQVEEHLTGMYEYKIKRVRPVLLY